MPVRRKRTVRTVFIDVDSFADRGDYLVAWIKHIPVGYYKKYMQKLYAKNASYYAAMYAVSKKYPQKQILSEVCYDKKDQFVGSSSSPFSVKNFEEVVPDSLAEVIYKTILAIHKTAKQQGGIAKNKETQVRSL